MAKLKDKYVLDAPYTWGFYYWQSPVLMDYVAKMMGVDRGPFNPSFKYCELGCGNGLTSNILAASLPQANFFAVDLNPQHIKNAKHIAESGALSNITFLTKSFEDLLDQDLLQFDYITMQGVYTWVSAEVRQDILKFIDKFLKPDGLLYVSYNATPGWSEVIPIRQIMMNYIAGIKENSLVKAEKVLKYLKYLRDNKANYFINRPKANQFIDQLMAKDLNYIVHEYLNESWDPLYFSQVLSDMEQIGLEYCGSANLINNTSVIVPEKFRPLLNTAKTVLDYEEHKSFILDEVFRRDIYYKGKIKKNRKDPIKLTSDAIIGCNLIKNDVKKETKMGKLQISCKTDLDSLLIDAAVEGKRCISEIYALPKIRKYNNKTILSSIYKLLVTEQFRILLKKTEDIKKDSSKAFRISHKLNKVLLEERLLKDGKCFLASPVLGSGLFCNVISGLLLLASDNTAKDEIVSRALQIIKKSNATWHRKGKPVKKIAEQRKILEKELEYFYKHRVPVLLRFGIIEPIDSE